MACVKKQQLFIPLFMYYFLYLVQAQKSHSCCLVCALCQLVITKNSEQPSEIPGSQQRKVELTGTYPVAVSVDFLLGRFSEVHKSHSHAHASGKAGDSNCKNGKVFFTLPVARKISQSFCQKSRWQVIAKHTCIL